MSGDGKVSVSYNPGWLGLLGVIFVLCKIFAYGPIADWSWWLVLLPFYIGVAIVVGIAGIGLLGAGGVFGVAALIDKYDQRKRRIAREKAEVWKKLGGK
jgi:hypothetical protein